MLRSMDSRAERLDELLRNMRMFKALVRASLSRLLDSDGTFVYPYNNRMCYFDTLIEKF